MSVFDDECNVDSLNLFKDIISNVYIAQFRDQYLKNILELIARWRNHLMRSFIICSFQKVA
jgi:hypothetical protein